MRQSVLVIGALALGAAVCIGGPRPASAMDPAVPAALTPPTGTTLIERLTASGSQIYVCASHAVSAKNAASARDGAAAKDGASAEDATNTWTLKAPDAVLKAVDGTPVIHHFAGPTWQATDGSKVVGKLVAQQQAPIKGAVPWLLLSATETGAGNLAGTRYVQRLDTVGGAAPSGSCPVAGAELRVPYTAEYAFYR